MYRFARFVELPVSLYAIFVSQFPFAIIAAAVASYFVWLKAIAFEPTYRSAIRMDYLPNVEMVSVTKVGPFGCLYNTLWKLSDFERVDTIPEVTRRNINRTLLLESEPRSRRKFDVPQQIDGRASVV